MKVKDTVQTNVKTIKTVYKNIVEFADAACLGSVSGFSIYEALNHKGVWYKALLFAGLLIALQAFVLLAKFFNKPTK